MSSGPVSLVDGLIGIPSDKLLGTDPAEERLAQSFGALEIDVYLELRRILDKPAGIQEQCVDCGPRVLFWRHGSLPCCH
ncbi:MAG TPA: hypothetical protein PLZ16_14760 [Gammaproteobacteria bacterium]|nr:hypothetical protein [Gammaproteobacteria bacterium]